MPFLQKQGLHSIIWTELGMLRFTSWLGGHITGTTNLCPPIWCRSLLGSLKIVNKNFFPGHHVHPKTVLFVWIQSSTCFSPQNIVTCTFFEPGVTGDICVCGSCSLQMTVETSPKWGYSWLLGIAFQIGILLFMHTCQAIITMIGNGDHSIRKGSIKFVFYFS